MADHFKPYIFQSLEELYCVLIPKGEKKNLCLTFIKRIDSLRGKGQGNRIFVLKLLAPELFF